MKRSKTLLNQLKLMLLGCLLFSGSLGAAGDLTVYGNALDAAWANWSWNTTVNLAHTTPAHSASQSVSVSYTAAWAGFYLHTDNAVDASQYENLSFWIHGGNTGNQQIRLVANGDSNATYTVSAVAGQWTQVTVPLSALGNPATLSDLYWQDATGTVQAAYYLDDIALTARTGTPPPPSAGPDLNIDVSAQRHAISEDIYGINFPDETLASELKLPVARWGGNATSRYNWQTSVSNHTSDYFYENIPEGNVNVANLPNGSASDQFVDQNLRTGTKSLITLPLIGWTPKASSPRNHPYDCGFKVSKYGAQQSVDPYDTNCGNGKTPNGSNITGNSATDTSSPIDPSFVSGWIEHLKSRYGTAANGGVNYYNLDNEPMLWNSTHRDVHPNPVTYDEIGNLTSQYAAAIKSTDPTAKTVGPALWGWCAYLYSALDGCSAGADYAAHGNKVFIAWYLEQMNLYEQQHGVRILDYVDLHLYPQANGVALGPAGNAATQALRLRSTRSLWDGTYKDESWISDTENGGVAIRFIPRLKDWVASNYPGTKLAITEYNWGGLEHINGALAEADVLGIFGREGLDLATLWSPPANNQPGAFAFRLYRNYDGAAHGFGDVSVQAASADQGILSVFAAQRSTDNTLTVMVINKSANDLSSAVNLAGFTPGASAQVYRYSSSNLAAIEKLPDQAVSGNGFTAVFPRNSITLFALNSGVAAETLSIAKTGTGSGTVTPDTGSINWSSPNAGTYSFSAPVTLTAAVDTGSDFTGWTGCDSTQGNTCTLSTVSTRAVSAAFTLKQYTLTANSTGTGSATISSSTGGIQYTYPAQNTGSEPLDHGGSVTLSAAALNGSVLAWAGDCTVVNGSDCTLNNINAAKTVTLTATSAAPECTFSISPTAKKFTRAGGKANIKVTATPKTCSWTAQSTVDWVSLSGSYTGSKTLSYTVARNRTNLARNASLTVAGKTFTVMQAK